jgi:ankyrin repeat protein
MKLLIAYSSLLNTININSCSILLNAIDSFNNKGLRIILEAGANPNLVVLKGLFRNSPLIAAGISNKLEIIKLLIEFGAKIDATNPEG